MTKGFSHLGEESTGFHLRKATSVAIGIRRMDGWMAGLSIALLSLPRPFSPWRKKAKREKKNEKSHQGFGGLTGYPKLMANFQKQKTLKDSEAPAPSKVGTIHILHDDVEFPSESKGIQHLELTGAQLIVAPNAKSD